MHVNTQVSGFSEILVLTGQTVTTY